MTEESKNKTLQRKMSPLSPHLSPGCPPSCPPTIHNRPVSRADARRQERIEREAQESAARKLIDEARQKRVAAERDRILPYAERVEKKLSESGLTQRFKTERKAERRRLAKIKKRIAERQAIGGDDEPEMIEEEFPSCPVPTRPFFVDENIALDPDQVAWRDHGLDEVLPAQWTVDHLCRRLIEAFETLSVMPIVTRPKGLASVWPGFVSDGNTGRRRNTPAAPQDAIARMEVILEFQGRFMGEIPRESRLLFRWAYYRAMGRSIADLAKEYNTPISSFRRHRERAAAALTATLNDMKEPVI
jgi:hypothetical protein